MYTILFKKKIGRARRPFNRARETDTHAMKPPIDGRKLKQEMRTSKQGVKAFSACVTALSALNALTQRWTLNAGFGILLLPFVSPCNAGK